ncbi:MAG: hypothetical protein M1815_004775 [Lichina confinis]|nr:MAG: hypothetical protein M1815_004775 [Lichina confinis]
MADRFPSIEEFSEGETEARGNSRPGLDPTASTDADFLAREKAALGDDADLFASAGDQQNTVATVQDADEDDLLGGSGAHDTDGVSEFQSSFPAIDAGNSQIGPGGTITGSSEPFLSQPPTSTFGGQQSQDDEEPQVIREWRERRDLAIQHRDEASQRRKEETVKGAQQSIDEFYENYNTKKEKHVAQTRKEAEDFLASRQDTSAGGTSWERIAKLVDLTGKGARGGASGTGKERFRELLLSLKKDERAPGATGY